MIFSITRIIYNSLFMAAAISWLIAQVMKVVTASVKNGGFSRQLLTSSGGFPSSHSATVSALVAMSFRLYGGDSEIFAVTFFLAMIVMYDAVGVRAETGRQSEILNGLMKNHPELFESQETGKTTGEGKHSHVEKTITLNEKTGHTLPELIAGIAIGVLVSAFLPVL